MSNQLDTQVIDDPQLDPALQDDPDAPGGADEPFLKVSDRQVYKTREEAIKGYEEASKMGATFGEIRKVAKEFGLQNLEPQLLRQLFSELVTHRGEKAKPAAKVETPTTSVTKSNVTPEIEAARQWLKDNAKEAGYVSKEDVEALAKELAELKGGLSSKDAEQRDSLISEGQEAVSGWLAEAKDASGQPISLNDDERTELEETIATWINSSKARIDRFYKGGTTSLSLVKEGYTKVLPIVKSGAIAFPNPAAKVAASGKTKTELISRNPKKMPNDGSAPGKTDATKPMRIGDPRLHNQVKNKLARLLAQDSGD
jgi:hypothetical protein